MSGRLDFTVYADGSCNPNPGPARLGVIVESADGRPAYRLSQAIGHGTSNIAEWQAAIAALTWLLAHGYGRTELRMDSRLIVNQLAGRWRVKHANLQPLATEGRRLLEAVRAHRIACDVRWIPRAYNRADAIADCTDAPTAGSVRFDVPGVADA